MANTEDSRGSLWRVVKENLTGIGTWLGFVVIAKVVTDLVIEQWFPGTWAAANTQLVGWGASGVVVLAVTVQALVRGTFTFRRRPQRRVFELSAACWGYQTDSLVRTITIEQDGAAHNHWDLAFRSTKEPLDTWKRLVTSKLATPEPSVVVKFTGVTEFSCTDRIQTRVATGVKGEMVETYSFEPPLTPKGVKSATVELTSPSPAGTFKTVEPDHVHAQVAFPTAKMVLIVRFKFAVTVEVGARNGLTGVPLDWETKSVKSTLKPKGQDHANQFKGVWEWTIDWPQQGVAYVLEYKPTALAALPALPPVAGLPPAPPPANPPPTKP